MADYVVNNGNIQMMIRDLGIGNNYVEYWVKTDQYTYNHQQKWSATGHGVETFDMNNRGSWQYVGNCYVGGSQNVSFTMYNASLGFPTYTYTVWISRASVPPPPYFVDVHPISSSAIHTVFYGAGDGNSPLREWQLGYGTDPNYPQYFVGSSGTLDVGGLDNRYTWYFWARGRNDIGWSGWSGRAQARPWTVPDPPTIVTVSAITQRSLHTSFSGNWDGGTGVDNWQLAYGQDPNNPQVFLDSQNNGLTDLTNLDPGKTYYFWARGHNAVGWGGWSPKAVATLIAGARINDAGVWQRAVPYVNVGGVWQLARPWIKDAGVWKESQQ